MRRSHPVGMIYLCTGCSHICKFLDKACTELSKACGEVCKPLGKCIEFVCTPITKVLDRPFGFYVIFAGMVNIPAAIVAVLGVFDPKVAACKKHPLVIFCVVDIVLAIMHVAMALYIQNRLAFGMQEGVLNAKSPAQHMTPQRLEAQDAGAPAAAGDGQELSTRDLMKRAGEIILYDVGFCLYVFAFIGAFVFNGMGLDWVEKCNTGSALPRATGGLHLFFIVGAICIAGVWLCFLFCQACCDCLDGSSKRRQQQQQRPQHQNPPKQQKMATGLTTLVFGRKKAGTILRAPPQQPQQGVILGPQGPIQGVPAAAMVYGQQHPQQQAMPAPSAPPMAAPMASPTPSAPPPPQQQPPQKGGAAVLSTVGGFAAGKAAAGMGMAGRGLQAVGKKLDKKNAGHE